MKERPSRSSRNCTQDEMKEKLKIIVKNSLKIADMATASHNRYVTVYSRYRDIDVFPTVCLSLYL